VLLVNFGIHFNNTGKGKKGYFYITAMPKTSRNKKSKSENILELLYRLKERNLLDDFERDLGKRKGGEVFKGTFKAFKDFLVKELPIEKVPSDQALAKQLKQTESQFNTTRRDFYRRILKFISLAVITKEKWYEEMLEILSDVDALWGLKLYDQAEMRFIDIYKIYPADKNLQHRTEYNYGLSKLAYYGITFFAWESYLGLEDVHKEFFKKEQFQLIRQIEMTARSLDAGKVGYGNSDEWPSHQAVFRFHNLLGAISKQKKELGDAREHLRKQEESYNHLAAAFHFQEQHGKRIFRFFSDNEPKEATEIETAFYFYLRLEAFRLSVIDGDQFQAQQILQELYVKVNESYEKSRNNWAAMVIFLKSELEKATYAVPFTAQIIEEKAKSFSSSFLASKKEINSLLLRLEILKASSSGEL